MESALLLKAAVFAAERHGTQLRKGEGKRPYIVHPLAVAYELASAGFTDLNLLTAALLHDVLEDTNTTADDLSKAFGSDVLALVLEVTDDKALDKDARKTLQVSGASHLTWRATALRVADKLCNVRDLLKTPPPWPLERKVEYVRWATSVVDAALTRGPQFGTPLWRLARAFAALDAEHHESLRA